MTTTTSNRKQPTYLYKIVHSSSPPPAQLPERLPLSPLDEADGFIHLSTAVQVPRTLSQVFKDDTRVYLLRLPFVHAVEKNIQWEDPEGTAPDDADVQGLYTCAHLHNSRDGRQLGLGSNEVDSVQVVDRDGDVNWVETTNKISHWLIY